VLRELRIKNFAVIDETAIELGPGLNVLTGETGAGKSIILDALGIVSGDRVSSDVIRHGADEASVEALFDGVPAAVRARLEDAGYACDGELIVKRVVSRSGKNRIYIGASLAPLNLLAEVGSALVHIYGQHEHHALVRAETHLALLDGFAALEQVASEMARRFHDMASAWRDLEKARRLVEERQRRRVLALERAEEIAAARLRPEEEEELRATKQVLAHAEKLYAAACEGQELLYEGEGALIGRLGKYAARLRDLAGIDPGLKTAVELLDGALAGLEEAHRELYRYGKRVHFEPGALDRVENRLAEIERLKRKYNGSVEDCLRVEAEAREELNALERAEEELPELQDAFEAARAAAWDMAVKLSFERRKAAKRLKRSMERELKSLGMSETTFELHFTEPGDARDEPPFLLGGKKLSAAGIDQIEFHFSPNPGEPPKPLGKIASGGELSRLMLALKALVLAPGDVPTLLFDEVDAGIGGGVAEIVGQKLKQVASAHQVVCVTHLPQIAALADCHHVVRKEVARGRTYTTVRQLKADERVEEVARMLGGLRITEKTRRHAEEMVTGGRR